MTEVSRRLTSFASRLRFGATIFVYTVPQPKPACHQSVINVPGQVTNVLDPAQQPEVQMANAPKQTDEGGT